MENNEKCYPCPCCGFLTRSELDHGTFEICPVCNWEDDYVQYKDPDFKGGANEESLNEARENYKKTDVEIIIKNFKEKKRLS